MLIMSIVMWYPCKHALFYLVDHGNLIGMLYTMVGQISLLLFIWTKILLYVMHVCLVTLGSAPFAPTEFRFLAMLLHRRELKLIKPRSRRLRVGRSPKRSHK